MFTLVRNLLRPSGEANHVRRPARTARLELMQLERRDVLSATANLSTVTGTLSITGSDSVEQVSIIELPQTIGGVSYLQLGGVASVTINGSPYGPLLPSYLVRSLSVDLKGSGDTFSLIRQPVVYYDAGGFWMSNPWYSSLSYGYVFGGNGGDVLDVSRANPAAFSLYGEGGDDTLRGGPGGDTLSGGANNDRLFGNAGYDYLYGGDNDDWLEAGSASEYASGGSGTDWNAHRWAVNGAVMTDVRQLGSGTCAFLSSLAGASQYTDLSARISYLGNYNYAVTLFDAAAGRWINQTVRFDGTLQFGWIDTNGDDVTDAWAQVDPGSVTEGEFWTIVYQRAYLRRFYGITDGAGTAAFDGEWPDAPERAITGQASSVTWVHPDFPWLYGIPDVDPWALRNLAWTRTAVACDSAHCYTLYDVYTDSNGEWQVTLFNPWGTDRTHNGTSFYADGSDDGYITMSLAAFKWFLPNVYATNA